MQKLLAILAAGCVFNAMAAPNNPPSGDTPPTRTSSPTVSGQATTGENVDEKRARVQSFAQASRACTSRMYGQAPRGRSAPNWNLYDQCMRERGMA